MKPYYQFVSRDLFPESWKDPKTGSTNNERSYKKLGSMINDARLAGLIDWDHISDRTRNVEKLPVWDSPSAIVAACAEQFRTDRWAKQPYYVEVLIEKDALAGVFERVCHELRVPFLSCRGYTSQSEMWRTAMRFKEKLENDKILLVLHFGDHDPSGIDMSRDIKERLEMFMGGVEFKRVALNMDQIEEHSPPPNPTKVTDSRAEAYIAEFGEECFELDSMNPTILANLVREQINRVIDQEAWDEAVAEEQEHRRLLGVVAEDWKSITEGL